MDELQHAVYYIDENAAASDEDTRVTFYRIRLLAETTAQAPRARRPRPPASASPGSADRNPPRVSWTR